MRGPKPKPTALKRLKGNPGRRPLNAFEPHPAPVTRLAVPAHLRPDARRIWRTLATQLQAVGLFTELDVPKVTVLAVALAEHRRCYEQLHMALETQPGVDTAGLARALRQAAETVKSLSNGFGMDPGDRVRLAVAPRPEASDPFREFDAAPPPPAPDRATQH
jgi:P27 family predicted phage terminase small subunit